MPARQTLAHTALLYHAGPFSNANPSRLEKIIRQLDQPMLSQILGDKICMRCRFRDRPCGRLCKSRRTARRKVIERAIKKGTAEDLRKSNGARKTKFLPKVMRAVCREITKDANIGITKVHAIIENKFDTTFSRGGLHKAMTSKGDGGRYLQWFRQKRGGFLTEEHRLHRLEGVRACLKRNPAPKNENDINALSPYLVTY